MKIGNLEIPKIENKYDAYGNIINSGSEYREIDNYGHSYFEELPIDVEKLKEENLSMQSKIEELKVKSEVYFKDMLKHEFEGGFVRNTTLNQQRREEKYYDVCYRIKELKQQIEVNEWLIRRSDKND